MQQPASSWLPAWLPAPKCLPAATGRQLSWHCHPRGSPGSTIPTTHLGHPCCRGRCPAAFVLGVLRKAAKCCRPWSLPCGVWEPLTAQHRNTSTTSTSSTSAHGAGHCPPAVALLPTPRCSALQGSAEQFPGVLTVGLGHQVV